MSAAELVHDVCLLMFERMRQVRAGEITHNQMIEELREILMRARLEMGDEEFSKAIPEILQLHADTAAELSARGVSVPSNDPKNPT